MNEDVADFVVIGSTPFARLLAGLLAGAHGRRVVFVGESQSSYRLARGMDLSIAPITRPESWALLAEGVAESLRLIGRIVGRGAWTHADPIFFTDRPRAIEALSHMRHMAHDFGIAVEPTPPSMLGAGRFGITLRDAVRLNRPMLEPLLDTWLEETGVRRLWPKSVTLANDGSAALKTDDGTLTVRQTILADSEAILAHLPRKNWPCLLTTRPAAAALTMPTRSLSASVMLEIHTGLTLHQHAEGGIAMFGMGDIGSLAARLQALPGQQSPLELAGQTGFTRIVTRDGAPAFGRIGGTGADLIAGLGLNAAFLAPALARWFCAEAAPHEASWFGARLVSRTGRDMPVAEFAPDLGSGAA